MAADELNLLAEGCMPSFYDDDYWEKRDDEIQKQLEILKQKELEKKKKIEYLEQQHEDEFNNSPWSVPESVLDLLEGHQQTESDSIENNAWQETPVTSSSYQQPITFNQDIIYQQDPEEYIEPAVLFPDSEDQQILFHLLQNQSEDCSPSTYTEIVTDPNSSFGVSNSPSTEIVTNPLDSSSSLFDLLNSISTDIEENHIFPSTSTFAVSNSTNTDIEEYPNFYSTSSFAVSNSTSTDIEEYPNFYSTSSFAVSNSTDIEENPNFSSTSSFAVPNSTSTDIEENPNFPSTSSFAVSNSTSTDIEENQIFPSTSSFAVSNSNSTDIEENPNFPSTSSFAISNSNSTDIVQDPFDFENNSFLLSLLNGTYDIVDNPLFCQNTENPFATESYDTLPGTVPNVTELSSEEEREQKLHTIKQLQIVKQLKKQKQELLVHSHSLHMKARDLTEQQHQEGQNLKKRQQEEISKLQRKRERQLGILHEQLKRRREEQGPLNVSYLRNQERLKKYQERTYTIQREQKEELHRRQLVIAQKRHDQQTDYLILQIRQHKRKLAVVDQRLLEARTSLGRDLKVENQLNFLEEELFKTRDLLNQTREIFRREQEEQQQQEIQQQQQQERPITTPTPVTTPTISLSPINSPSQSPTPTPITSPIPSRQKRPRTIPTPVTTPTISPIYSAIQYPTPTPRRTPTTIFTPTPIRKPTTEPKPTPNSEPTTTEPRSIQLPTIPAASLTVEEANRLNGDRIKLLTDLKVREDQAIDKREETLRKFQQDEINARNTKNDIERQLRIVRDCSANKENSVRRPQIPFYKQPKVNPRQKRFVPPQPEISKRQRFPPGPRKPLLPKKMMHNEMVSIPVGSLNGGLKATSSGSGVVGTSSVVSSAVLANAPRVYLTPTATFMANRQATVAAQATGKIGGATIVGVGAATSSSAATVASTGTVRYFSQFSKLQTSGGSSAPVLQKKLVNGDTIVLSNGTRSRILTSNSSSSGPALAAAPTPAPVLATANGGSIGLSNCLQMNKMAPLGGLDETVIKNHIVVDKPAVASSQQQQQQQQDHPLELVAGTSCEGDEPEPELDITINNVVCSFSVRCHLKLREIALNGSNVEYRRENGMVTMKLRHPYTTASIWSSGRITCTGATSEPMAKVAARRYARCLGKLGFPTRFQNFRIVNVLGTCSMPWAIKIVNFSERHRSNASYEPELHPGVTYKMIEPKATLKIFSTGSITVTAASVNDVEAAIQHIYPLVFEFRKQRSAEELLHLRQKQRRLTGGTDPNELEEMIISENKAAAVNDIFVNTTAAHTNKTDQVNSTIASSSVCAATLNTVQRSKQLESYRTMMQQTQEERRHIPFHGNSTTTATALNASKPSTSATASASSSSTSDNICASARRRATECWATKLQNKRPRYNAACATAPTSNSFSNVASTSAQALAQAQAQAQTHLRNPLKTAALANARMRGTNQTVVSQASSVAASRLGVSGSSAGFLPAQQRPQQQQPRLMQHQQLQPKLLMHQRSFSPSDFQVDDLIEEEELNELENKRLNNTGTLESTQ